MRLSKVITDDGDGKVVEGLGEGHDNKSSGEEVFKSTIHEGAEDSRVLDEIPLGSADIMKDERATVFLRGVRAVQ